MRTAAFVITVSMVVMAASSAYGAKISFDPSSGTTAKRVDYFVPAALTTIALVAGIVLIILKRKKARGIWSSNNERLR